MYFVSIELFTFVLGSVRVLSFYSCRKYEKSLVIVNPVTIGRLSLTLHLYTYAYLDEHTGTFRENAKAPTGPSCRVHPMGRFSLMPPATF